MRTRRLLAFAAPTAFAASTAFTKLGRESRRENESVYPPPHAVRGRGTARKRGGGGMLSRGFFSDGGANGTAARPYPLAPLATSPALRGRMIRAGISISSLPGLTRQSMRTRRLLACRLNKSADRKAAYAVGNWERDKPPLAARPPPAGPPRHQGQLAWPRYGWCGRAQSRRRP
jgi:hypothetical protein